MIRRPPRSTLFPLHDALPIYAYGLAKALAFSLTILAGAAGLAPALRSPVFLVACFSVYASVFLCVVRGVPVLVEARRLIDRKSTRLNSSHANISYAVFCLKKK